MSELMKLSVISRMEFKSNDKKTSSSKKSALQEIGASMAKKSLEKVLLKI